ncbi:hypothetical protein [Spirosoma utsteinense]|uniref:Transposase n=1 Tax=Spirosoma utsteinense TaxID=2585773 RepID=A0ABR6WA02_9BACT|nr:hypothetical protein [Spirosoma utsteinense]MBC3787020.1 hypothetical protein [Spirosoma utsteinense]MBC3793398.1 hypothetical protein [Spirosoma utsteinense]
MSWLEYSQCVLDKVGFDRRLFRKELRKFLRLLTPTEQIQLLTWCRLRLKRSSVDAQAVVG